MISLGFMTIPLGFIIKSICDNYFSVIWFVLSRLELSLRDGNVTNYRLLVRVNAACLL